MDLPPDDALLIEDFVEHLARERRLSPNTVDAYHRDISQLAHFLARSQHSLETATLEHLRRFLAQQTTLGYARASVARRVGAIRTFYRWAHARGVVANDPAALLGRPKGASRLPSACRGRGSRRLRRASVRPACRAARARPRASRRGTAVRTPRSRRRTTRPSCGSAGCGEGDPPAPGPRRPGAPVRLRSSCGRGRRAHARPDRPRP